MVTVFNSEQVTRLTGVTARQLQHWHTTGFLGPDVMDEGAYGSHPRALR